MADEAVELLAEESDTTLRAFQVASKPLVVFSGPETEVTVRAVDGGYALDVDSEDEELAEGVRAAVEDTVAIRQERP